MHVYFNEDAAKAGFPGWCAKHGWPLAEGFTREEAVSNLLAKLPPEKREQVLALERSNARS